MSSTLHNDQAGGGNVKDAAQLVGRLRSAKVFGSTLYAEAADEIDRLRATLSRKESTIATITNALNYAEKECGRHRTRAQELDNEIRRLQSDMEQLLQSVSGEAANADELRRELDRLQRR